MSFLPPHRPPPLPKPAARGRKPARSVAAGGPGWGWLEWLVLSQTVLPALMFIPGLSAVRTPTRIAAYLVSPLAWVFVAWRGEGDRPGARSFPARPWLIFCTAWLTLSILHPDAYSLTTATAKAALYIAILSPAFWAPAALESSRQIPRLLAILFLCNAASALVGIGQVFLPRSSIRRSSPRCRTSSGART